VQAFKYNCLISGEKTMRWFFGFMLVGTLFAGTAWASNPNQVHVDYILKRDTAPFGVVFEIVEGSRADLEWAVEEIKKYSAQLRKRFPDIGIAVVSHGTEQFALMTAEAQTYDKVHKSVKSLTEDESIPVHVCGTHASWYGKSADDFPDYVTVSPAGPTEIANYEDMGYEKIVLEEP
jgi:intracellular sulfur oxidation DsrE/DsrF family protein